MKEVILAARDLAFGYPGRCIGSGVTLEVRRGEVLCLLGPNGSGKTTLFRTLLGLLPAHRGSVFINGAEARTVSREAVARQISYVPQAHGAFFPFTVREIVLMGRVAHISLFAAPSQKDHAAADAAIERMGLTALADRSYTRISGGERQLTLIARALAQEAPVVVMDEPTANLDFGNQVRVLERIRTLADAGTGVLLSTHDPDHVFLCADRVAMLHDGRLVACGTPGDEMTAQRLCEIYGIEVTVRAIEMAGGVQRTVCLPQTISRNVL